ncbi:MAG: DUF1343 domain-containing protein [Flavobacteriales bacterium]|nr:DUF1343 domain-containing protein [Flavobacteriales bacterium]
MNFNPFIILLFVILFLIGCTSQKKIIDTENILQTSVADSNSVNTLKITEGAERLTEYLPLIREKRVGIVANHTSFISGTHLVDTLLQLKINIVKVFSPEHGFRGKADAGENVSSDVDKSTGLPLISLYGKNKKPTAEQLSGIDVVIFDIQDVGARFYTYISTMHYVMEACAENNIELIVLDRPNPNGDYVDGPVLKKGFESFVGMHSVPIVHGLTIGEYAQMINGEEWLLNQVKCKLQVIKMEGYSHTTHYVLPIKPSPNLPNMQAVYLYPSICLFEGTAISLGRGTEKPFQMIGHPKLDYEFYFIPKPTYGAKEPLLKGQKCFGIDLSNLPVKKELDLSYLIDFYKQYPAKDEFFHKFFNTLAGNSELQQQIKNDIPLGEIKLSWRKDIEQYKAIRKKYLLYQDFE